MDKKKRVKEIEKEDYNDFYDFDIDELDDIFDQIQEANPDLWIVLTDVEKSAIIESVANG